MNDTVIEMKKRIYRHVKGIFKDKKVPKETDEEQFELWINKNILMMIKDNTPYVQKEPGAAKRKAECEFCGRRHNYRDDMCEICTPQHSSGNKLDNGARLIKLRDLYSMLKN